MLEVLILYALLNKDLTTYGIRKNIAEKFFIFSNPSLGAIHPSVVKLAEKNYIQTTKIITNGGQKSIFHHLTTEGKKHFYSLWEKVSANVPYKICAEIKIKISMLPSIKSAEHKNNFFENANNALELIGYDVKNFMAKNTDGFFQTSASLFYKEVADLKNTIEKLKKECVD